MIRLATEDDIPRLVEMTDRFIRETAYFGFITPNKEVVETWFLGLINGADSFILVSEGGVIQGALGCALVPHFLDGKKSAFELFWWVEPEFRGIGGELFKFYEWLIKERGAVRSFFVAPENTDISKYYEKQGYSKFETTYVREF